VQGWGGELNEFAGNLLTDSTGTKLFVVGGYESGEFYLGSVESDDTMVIYRSMPWEEGEAVGSTFSYVEMDAKSGEVAWAGDYGDGKGVAVVSDAVQMCIVGSYSTFDKVGEEEWMMFDDDDDGRSSPAGALPPNLDTLLACVSLKDDSETWTRGFAGDGDDVPTDLVVEDPMAGRGGEGPRRCIWRERPTAPSFSPHWKITT